MTRCLSWIMVLSIIAIVGSMTPRFRQNVRIVPIPYFYPYHVHPRGDRAGGLQGEFGQDPGTFPFIDPDQEPPPINPMVQMIAAIAVIAAAVPLMQETIVPSPTITTAITTTATVATTTTTVTTTTTAATDPCVPNPCLNSGQCRSSNGVFVGCNCMPTFCGTLCNCNLIGTTCICP